MTAINQMNGFENELVRALIARESVSSSFSVTTETLQRSSKTELSHLTQLAMINCRLLISTALAEQEQHYSCPTTAVSP
jgi:hypothetical protein